MKWYFAPAIAIPYPKISPAMVPITPISTPWNMKTLRIWLRRAPMEISTAMSFVFSMTIMMREIRIFRAVLRSGDRDPVPQNQSRYGPDYSDQHALEHENPADLE